MLCAFCCFAEADQSSFQLDDSCEDGLGTIKVSANKFICDQLLVDSGYAYQSQLDDAKKNGKTLVAFNIGVENLYAGEFHVFASDFNLIDTENRSISSEVSKEGINATLIKGTKCAGIIMFSLAPDSIPKALYYSPNLTVKLETLSQPQPEFAVKAFLPIHIKKIQETFVRDEAAYKAEEIRQSQIEQEKQQQETVKLKLLEAKHQADKEASWKRESEKRLIAIKSRINTTHCRQSR